LASRNQPLDCVYQDEAPGSPPPGETASVATQPTNMARVNPPAGAREPKAGSLYRWPQFSRRSGGRHVAQILGKHGIEAKVEPAGGGLGTGRISRLSTDGGAQLVCLSYLDADLSPAGARFVVRRLRRRLGEIKILAGFWRSGPGQAGELCAKTKADFCATRFSDALEQHELRGNRLVSKYCHIRHMG
jgi:hypothetical protein